MILVQVSSLTTTLKLLKPTSLEGSIDSFLIIKKYFNTKGWTTLTEIYDRDVIRCSYSYKYRDDTVRIERITVCGGKFVSKT